MISNIGISILCISLLVVFVLVSLTYVVGLVAHFIRMEFEYLPMSILCSAIIVGIWMVILGV